MATQLLSINDLCSSLFFCGGKTCSRESERNIPEDSLVRARRDEEVAISTIEEGEVGVDLQDPVRLNSKHARNVNEVASSA